VRFEDALKAMRERKMVGRHCWASGTFLAIGDGDTRIAMVYPSGKCKLLSSVHAEDLVAEDWYVVDYRSPYGYTTPAQPSKQIVKKPDLSDHENRIRRLEHLLGDYPKSYDCRRDGV
jgi:hypothetical protein